MRRLDNQVAWDKRALNIIDERTCEARILHNVAKDENAKDWKEELSS